jgi:hypothetical protein
MTKQDLELEFSLLKVEEFLLPTIGMAVGVSCCWFGVGIVLVSCF